MRLARDVAVTLEELVSCTYEQALDLVETRFFAAGDDAGGTLWDISVEALRVERGRIVLRVSGQISAREEDTP